MILLDTHVWVWWLSGSAPVSKAARAAIDDAIGANAVHVSAISAWEVSLLVRVGRLELTVEVEDWVARSEALPFLRLVPVDARIALRANALPGDFHADPADRMIVATARVLGAPLVTKDDRIRRYRHVRTIW